MRTALRLPLAFALGFATAFFLDPRNGKRRRHALRDGTLHRGRGLAAEARTSVAPPADTVDDAAVKQRILSDALRSLAVATSDVRVDVSDGVATLRGVVASHALADDLVARVREVPGVRGVSAAIGVAGEPPRDS